jgi:hypothetical protein
MSPLVVLGLSALGTALAWPLLNAGGRAAGWLAALLPLALFVGLAPHLQAVVAGGEVVEGVSWSRRSEST